MSCDDAPLLELRDVKTYFFTDRGVARAVDGVSFTLERGKTLGIVGESGSGKSVTALSILRLVPWPPGKTVGGEILFEGEDLLTKSDEEMRHVRGREIAMVFQEPMTSLNPVLTIGRQLTEAMVLHLGYSKARARERAIELLRRVQIPDPEHRLTQYPHHLSGGMRQRVMLAMALSCGPKLILADEPTTALDVTVQAQILRMMKDLSRELGVAMIIVTHNLGVVARYADDVAVMYAGRIVEHGTAAEVFGRPRHPYTVGLLRSVPRPDRRRTERLHTIEGQPPDLVDLPSGCVYRPRCPLAEARCEVESPPLVEVVPGHRSACWFADRVQVVGDGDGADPVMER